MLAACSHAHSPVAINFNDMQIQSVAIAIHLPSPPLLICIYIIVIYLFFFLSYIVPSKMFQNITIKMTTIVLFTTTENTCIIEQKHNINCQTYC